MNLAFIQKSHVGYSASSLGQPTIRGIETSIIQLSQALAHRGHRVTVFNSRNDSVNDGGVYWQPLANMSQWHGEAIIAANEPKLFTGTSAKRKILWLHNRVSVEKALRKGRLIPLWVHQPLVVVSSVWHQRDLVRILTPKGVCVIPLGVADIFHNAKHQTPLAPPVIAFTADKTRGFEEFATLWQTHIFPMYRKHSLWRLLISLSIKVCSHGQPS